MNPYAPSSSKHPPDEPITRSRTLFYLSVRDSSSFGTNRGPRLAAAQYGDTVDVEDDERGGLLGGHSTHVDMHGLPPKWVDVNDEVEDILERVKAKVATLDKLHAKHVMPSFTDRSAEEREIERQTADITRDFRRCTNLIASIAPGRGAPRVEVMTSKNVQRGLAGKVQEASALFRKKQRVYMQSHAVKNKDLLAASGAITLRGADSLDALDEDEEASRNQLQSQSTTTMTVETNIEQRSQEITQIASSISELADLFRDLGNLVVEQGTVLDSVEYNVQQTSKSLSEAVEELHVARTYQRNTGKRKCILLLILLIILMIVILIYKPRGGGGSDEGGDGEKEGKESSSQSATLSGGSSFLLPTTAYRVAAVDVDVTSAIRTTSSSRTASSSRTTSSSHSASSTVTPESTNEAGHRLPGLGSYETTSKAVRPRPSLLTQGGSQGGKVDEYADDEYAEDEYWDDEDEDDRRAWR